MAMTGLLGVRQSASGTNATITEVIGIQGVVRRPRRSYDLGYNPANAGKPDRPGRAFGQVKYAAADEGTAVIDGDHHAAFAVGDPEPGAERQGAVRRSHGVLVKTLAGSGFAAGFTAVIRCYS